MTKTLSFSHYTFYLCSTKSSAKLDKKIYILNSEYNSYNESSFKSMQNVNYLKKTLIHQNISDQIKIRTY